MKNYCMSAYLTFRFIPDESMNFFDGLHHKVNNDHHDAKYTCDSGEELGHALEQIISAEYVPGKTAVLLSGGIDSAVVASYLPAGTKAYTLKCLAEGAIDETKQASYYAKAYNLDHEIIEITWDDIQRVSKTLFQLNQVPFHSIEAQFYIAACLAKQSGIEKLFTGEGADLIYGGMDKLLSQDWEFQAFIKRYTFLEPEKVLKKPVSMNHVYELYKKGDSIDLLAFMHDIYSVQSATSYMQSFTAANISYLGPYVYTRLGAPLDLARVRSGEPKYHIQELFRKRYPGMVPPAKIPMPRAMDQWLANWEGPIRYEFLPQCVDKLTGDQKWLVYCLEQYLNHFEPIECGG